MKREIKDFVTKYGSVLLAALITAFSVEVLLIPNNVIFGSAIGVASIIELTAGVDNYWFSAGLWVLVLDIPLLIFCAFNFSKKFTVRTSLYVLLMSAFLLLFRHIKLAEILDIAADSDTVALVLMGAGLSGLSLPLMLYVNGSTAGGDIAGLFLQTKLNLSSSESFRVMTALDAVVIVVGSIILQSINTFIYSMAVALVSEIIKELIFRGFSSNLELEITSDKAEEISEALREQLKHGTTILRGIGGYSHTDKTVVICIINKRQLTKARKIIRQIDPTCFAYVENVKEVLGRGFEDKEADLDLDKD